MDSVSGTILVLLLLTLWIVWTKSNKNGNKSRLPPGPIGLPIVGYLPFIDAVKPHHTFHQLSIKYGSIYSVQLGNVLAIIVTDPKLIKKALSQDVFTGRADLFLTKIMNGFGIICAEGDRWRHQRRFLLSCLKNFGMVKIGPKRDQLQNRIMIGVEELLMTIEKNANEDFDILNSLLHCVGNIMNSLVFGRTWEENDPMWRKLRHLAEEGVKHVGVAGPLNFLPFLRFIPKYRRVIDFIVNGQKETHLYYQQVIDSHDDSKEDDLIAAFKKHMYDDNFPSSSSSPVISKQNDNIFCRQQFYHFLADAFGAGLDTTVASLNWFLLFVAVHPHVQEKLHNDIDNNIDDSNGLIILLDSLPYLPYLEAAIAESQRMRPVTPIGIPHRPVRDTELDGYLIPEKCMFVPLIWSVHTDSDAWENPYQFNPNRFIDDRGKFFTPTNFMPFQSGKRACIGGELSKMMMFLFASNILKRYRVTLNDDRLNRDDILEGVCGITYTPQHHTFKFVPRI